MTFLPNDLTTSEADLAATITRHLLARRSPSTPQDEQAAPQDEQAARDEANQLAAEMIWEARREHGQGQDPEEESLEEDLADSAYHQRLARLRAESLAIQEAEDLEADQAL